MLQYVEELLKQFCIEQPDYSFEQNLVLGDAGLRVIVKQKLLEKYGTAEATEVESLVSDNLDDEKLARACVDNEMDRYISYENCEDAETKSWAKEQMEIFKTEVALYPSNCLGVLDTPKIAAAFVKSVLGAVHKRNNYDYDVLYESFEMICDPLFTKEKPALHPYDELFKRHTNKEFVLKTVQKRTSDGKNNVRVEIIGRLFEDMTSDLDMKILQNRAALSVLQKLNAEKARASSSHS